ncbi:recombination protein NinG [Aquimarina sp. 2-A2]|uniref:recombination protein NinG n=1 Tax=Aquimarina sp. 2-A2 TaxID=3382644 RepID=UPI00387EF814
MNNKKKKCKGIGKAYGFEGCLTETYYRTHGLCPKCLSDWFETEVGKIYFAKLNLKAKKDVEKKEKKKRIEEKKKITDFSTKLQTAINKIVRLLDIGLPCLARNYHANQMHAGHVFSRGSNKTMRFNLHNIHRQSAQSNHYQNEDGLLREGLKNEYGEKYFDFISSLRRTEALKFTNVEYEEFYRKACKIANRLKKEGNNYNLKERIYQRNLINKELGIYEDEYCEFKN